MDRQMINLGGQRWLSVLVLIAFLSGCSSSRIPIQSGSREMPEDKAGDQRVLEVGDEVIVVLLDGGEVKGRVLEISSSSIVLGHTGNYGYNETRIESQSIDRIDLVKIGVSWPLLVLGFVVVAVGFYVGLGESVSHLN